jgi:hypothetical protein
MKDALQFEVENKIDGIGAQTQYPGVCRPACSWNIDSPIARRSAVPA